jgi:YVTN family beta-propeller protein
MPARTMTARRPVPRWLVAPVVVISLAAGLGPVVPASAAVADVAQAGASRTASAGPGSPFTVYVANGGSDNVTPIQTATNTPGAPIPAGSQPFAIAITPDGKTAYVPNSVSGTVTPIDTATNTPGAPIPVGSEPFAIAITPDGKTAYVANYFSGTVTPIQTATNTPGAPIPVGKEPDPIAITPDGKTVYVANEGSDSVTPIQTATNTAEAPIAAGGQPSDIAITPDGKTVYVANIFRGTVTPIDTATNTPGAPIPVGNNPDRLAITPDGKTVYVANANYTGYFAGTVTPIATATNTPGAPIPVGTYPWNIAITPDGKTAYVVNANTSSYVASTVTPIDTTTNTPGAPIPVGNEPNAIAITPDGKTAYVANGASDTVTPIDTTTNTPGTPIPVGTRPDGIAITPTLTQAPTFTSDASYTATFRVAFRFTATTTGEPAPAITRTGRLPTGVKFTNNHNGTATISGAPRKCASGMYRLTLIAKNTAGTATQEFTLTVTRAPILGKLHTIRARVGRPVRRVIHAGGYPLPALTETGSLPRGLSFSGHGKGTAIVAGTPAAHTTGRYRITIIAANTSGAVTRHLTIIVSHHRHRRSGSGAPVPQFVPSQGSGASADRAPEAMRRATVLQPAPSAA